MSRLRADNLTNRSADGAPLFTHGVRVTGVVTSTTGDFSGNVSVGGTLTYEDVSNVDSVGLITARTGVRVTSGGVQVSDGGLSVTGITTFNDDIIGDNATNISGINSVTATSFYGDGSTLNGVQTNSVSVVASGTISNGDTVVVNTDGTVSVVSGSGTTESVGVTSSFEEDSTQYTSAIFDPTTEKIFVAYKDFSNSQRGTGIVGTVSGSTISWGSPVVFETDVIYDTRCVYDPDNGKVIVLYNTPAASGYGIYGRIVTITGTTPSFGTETSPGAYANPGTPFGAVYDTTNNKLVIAYYYVFGSTVKQGYSAVGTVGASTISWGTTVQFESSNGVINDITATFDSTNEKVVIAWSDGTNSSYGTAIVGTVSGTSISYGTKVAFNSYNTKWLSSTFDPNNGKVIISYTQNGSFGYSIVGTVSGTSISFGDQTIFSPSPTQYTSTTYDPDNQEVVVSYYLSNGTTIDGSLVVGTVSGTSITFGTPFTFRSAGSGTGPTYISSTYDTTNDKIVITFRDQTGSSNYGTAVVYSPATLTTNLTSENFIGIAAEAISDGATGKIDIIGGVNSGQSGLTTAQTYYVNPTGGIGLTASTPSVVAGTSISSTEIIVKG